MRNANLKPRDATQRQRAEEKLRTASLYARSLLEASLDPLVTISPEGTITDVNRATELATGVPRERLVGSDFCNYFTAPDQARTGYRRVLSEGQVVDYFLTIRHVSGRTTDVLYNATLYRDEAGRVQGVFAAARDITERRRMQQALQDNEARYRCLVTASCQIIWTTNAQGEVVEDLPSWRAYTGQSLAESLGSGWAIALHPEDRERTLEVWSRAVATRTHFDTEYRVRRHDGEYRHFAVRGVPVSPPDGPIAEWVGACTDITERQAAEKHRRVTSDLLALFARKTTLHEYLDAVADVLRNWSGSQALGIRIVGDHGEIPYEASLGFDPDFLFLESRLSLENDNCCCVRAVKAAPEAQDQPLLTHGGSFCCQNTQDFITGLTPDQQGRYRGNCLKFGYLSLAVVPIRYRDQVLGAVHLADRRPARFPAATMEFLESMMPLLGEAIHRFHAEVELSRYKDHLEVLVKQRTNELEAANAQLLLEIAERRRAEATLRATAQDLARSNQDLEQFAYVASHDLQEPLRAVAGYVQLLQSRFPQHLDEKGRQYIAGASEGAMRMQSLISDLLAFSRLGSQAKAFRLTPLETVLDTALSSLRASVLEAGASITHDPLPTLRADTVQLAQLFQNLIGNALKFHSDRPTRIHIAARREFSPPPSASPSLESPVAPQEISASPRPPAPVGPPADTWVFSVRDNGIGIEPQYFQRIFQIFQRLHTRKSYPGTGIGLAICKKIVERHGGNIWVESQPEQGSTFYFTVPALSANEKDQASSAVSD